LIFFTFIFKHHGNDFSFIFALIINFYKFDFFSFFVINFAITLLLLFIGFYLSNIYPAIFIKIACSIDN